MKKPPDVIVIDSKPKENALHKWINLMDWAKINGDEYLYQRAKQRLTLLPTQN
jgi:hypothetical protein